MITDLGSGRVNMDPILSVTRVYTLHHTVFPSNANLHLSNVETEAQGIK